MSVTVLLITSYLIIALFAIFMTSIERKQTGNRGFVLTMLGFLACVVWPITFVTVAIAAQRSNS